MSYGLAAQADGYALTTSTTAFPTGRAAVFRFAIVSLGGKPVTDFIVEQTKRMHVYAIRSDLTGFLHLHPSMAADGTWSTRLPGLQPGSWRLFAQFTPDAGRSRGRSVILSRRVTVPGMVSALPLPMPAMSTTADGYTVKAEGNLMAGMGGSLALSIAKDGKPVSDLGTYLGAYAHLTAFHEGDQAFAHFHPEMFVRNVPGGSCLSVHADLPKPGNWRLFVQFRAAGELRTAVLTQRVDRP